MSLQRLEAVDAFPEEQRDAMRAVAAAMRASGHRPGDYAAEIRPGARGQWEVYLRHDSHVDVPSGRGDLCARCRVVRYNPRTGKVSRITGIR